MRGGLGYPNDISEHDTRERETRPDGGTNTHVAGEIQTANETETKFEPRKVRYIYMEKRTQACRDGRAQAVGGTDRDANMRKNTRQETGKRERRCSVERKGKNRQSRKEIHASKIRIRKVAQVGQGGRLQKVYKNALAR